MIFRKFLPHLLMVLSVMMLTLFVIDSVNDAMGFLRGRCVQGFAAGLYHRSDALVFDVDDL